MELYLDQPLRSQQWSMLARRPWGQSWPLQVLTLSPCLDDSLLRCSSVVRNTSANETFLWLNDLCVNSKQTFSLCTHSKWAVRDVDSSPGDHGSVLYRFTWGVSTGIGAIAVILDLYIHRSTFTILCTCGKAKNKIRQNIYQKVCKTWRQKQDQPYLGHDLQRSFSSLLGINCELSGLSNSQTTALKAWTIGLNLELTHLLSFKNRIMALTKMIFMFKDVSSCMCARVPVCEYLVRVEVFAWRVDNLSHKGRVLNVFAVAEDMHSILPRLCGPVAHVTGSISLVVTFNLGLRWTFHRKSWRDIDKHSKIRKIHITKTHTWGGIFYCVPSLSFPCLTYPVYRRCLQQPPPQSQQIFQQRHPPVLDPRPSPSAGRPQHQSWPQWD